MTELPRPGFIYVVVCDDKCEGFDPSMTEVFTDWDKAKEYQRRVLSGESTAPKMWGYIVPDRVTILTRYVN